MYVNVYANVAMLATAVPAVYALYYAHGHWLCVCEKSSFYLLIYSGVCDCEYAISIISCELKTALFYNNFEDLFIVSFIATTTQT